MKLLLVSSTEDIDVLKGMLADQGIACEVTNDTIPLPGGPFHPKLWVTDDSDFSRASAILEAFRKVPAPKLGGWTCPACGEQLEGQFSSCWKCGNSRPAGDSALAAEAPQPPTQQVKEGHPMNKELSQEILTELRRLRQVNQRMFYLVAVLVVFLTIPASVVQRLRSSSRGESWEQVTTAMRRQDSQQALSLAQALVERQPNYYYGHAYLGSIYLSIDDPTNAEIQYSRAYELFPNEENEKNLAAIRKRLAMPHDFKLKSK